MRLQHQREILCSLSQVGVHLECKAGHKLKLARFFCKDALDLLDKAKQVPLNPSAAPLMNRRPLQEFTY